MPLSNPSLLVEARHLADLAEAGEVQPGCPICQSPNLRTHFVARGYPVCQCVDCTFVFLNPRPAEKTLSQIYTAKYFLGSDDEAGRLRVAEMKGATASLYLDQLIQYTGIASGRLLEIGCGTGDFLVAAQQRGFEVYGVDVLAYAVEAANRRLKMERVTCGTIETLVWEKQSFDVCALFDVIEHTRDPLSFLNVAHRLLKPGGVIFIATPSLDSWSARLMGRYWIEFKTEHLHYFSGATIENALARSGFVSVQIEPNAKILTPEYISYHFARFRVPVLSWVIEKLYRILSARLAHRPFKVVASGITVMARATAKRDRPLLSVIVPAYNEQATFETLLNSLLAKEVPGVDTEIIIVESNSTDDTRKLALLACEKHPEIKLILETRPQGKGHAVRRGLVQATGDFVLIQDADLEYDLNDYEALLEPLRKYQRAFVLGSRHSDHWHFRRFTNQPLTSLMFNLGHVFFLSLFNLLYGQTLTDPFTMYKVFRRDCLHRLHFESNRFDFDFEIVIKLLRKGYRPIEIPVSYRSRSFAEGKKVSVLYDPLTWIWVLVKFRFVSLYSQ